MLYDLYQLIKIFVLKKGIKLKASKTLEKPFSILTLNFSRYSMKIHESFNILFTIVLFDSIKTITLNSSIVLHRLKRACMQCWGLNRNKQLKQLLMFAMSSPGATHYPETHYPETHYPETHYPETHYPESHYPETHYPESITPNRQFD